MKLSYLLAASLALCALNGTAHAQQQFQADADIDSDDGDSDRYVGNDPDRGESSDGGRDAFDGFGSAFNLRGLTLLRQSEFFATQNLFRFFDTFTNDTGQRITTTINFFGNLGSDSDTLEVLSEDGLIVSCQFSDGTCAGDDPIVANVFNNNGVGLASLGTIDDEADYNALFRLALDPGQSASILNFAFLASEEEAGTTEADIDLAIARGRELQANPFAAGLTNDQRARTINFNLAPGAVPEPAAWSMMIVGFGAVGSALRRRRTTVRVSYAR